jgi:hypothetical protein
MDRQYKGVIRRGTSKMDRQYKGVIRRGTSKMDRQYNGQQKKDTKGQTPSNKQTVNVIYSSTVN